MSCSSWFRRIPFLSFPCDSNSEYAVLCKPQFFLWHDQYCSLLTQRPIPSRFIFSRLSETVLSFKNTQSVGEKGNIGTGCFSVGCQLQMPTWLRDLGTTCLHGSRQIEGVLLTAELGMTADMNSNIVQYKKPSNLTWPNKSNKAYKYK